MKPLLTLLLISLLTNAFSQSAHFVQYKDTINDFSIGVPQGWGYGPNKKYPQLKFVAIRTAVDASDKPHENFNLNILDKKNSSIEREYEKFISALESTRDFTILRKGDVNIHGQLYKWFIETHKNDINLVPTDNYVFMTYKNGKTYILTFVSYSKDFDKFEALFREIANTLIL